MEAKKKKIERYYLETFRDTYLDFPAGEIIDSEEPDFLIKLRDGSLGIELTELYHKSPRSGRPMQAVEKLTNLIVQEACSIHRALGGPVLTVRVDFDLGSERLGRSQRTDIASNLASLVLKTHVEIDERAELENDYNQLGAFPEEITRIRIRRNRFRSRALWSVPRAAFIPKLNAEHLQERIDEKNKRAAVYREKSPEVWLVIAHSLHFSLASTFENSNEALQHKYGSDFDKTFLLSVFGRRSFELVTNS